jgi:hypothetical protein
MRNPENRNVFGIFCVRYQRSLWSPHAYPVIAAECVAPLIPEQRGEIVLRQRG